VGSRAVGNDPQQCAVGSQAIGSVPHGCAVYFGGVGHRLCEGSSVGGWWYHGE
jgi:hypothetical protein